MSRKKINDVPMCPPAFRSVRDMPGDWWIAHTKSRPKRPIGIAGKVDAGRRVAKAHQFIGDAPQVELLQRPGVDDQRLAAGRGFGPLLDDADVDAAAGEFAGYGQAGRPGSDPQRRCCQVRRLRSSSWAPCKISRPDWHGCVRHIGTDVQKPALIYSRVQIGYDVAMPTQKAGPKSRTGKKPASRRPHDSEATKQALLDAATVEFAKHGYRDAGLREICERAGANTGVVHYHFGGKQQLYREALVRANRRLFEEAGVPERCDEDDPAVALRRWIGFGLGINLLRRPTHAAGRMLAFEVRDPTEALTDMVKQVYGPIRGMLQDIVSRVLAEALAKTAAEVDAELIASATDRVLSLVVLYEQHTPVLKRFGRPIPRTQAEVDALADAVAAFALGGIRAAAPHWQSENE